MQTSNRSDIPDSIPTFFSKIKKCKIQFIVLPNKQPKSSDIHSTATMHHEIVNEYESPECGPAAREQNDISETIERTEREKKYFLAVYAF
jgi:hypothetical protein